MALEVRPLNSKVQLKYSTGVDEEGNEITRSKTINNFRSEALDQDIYDVADALGSLQKDPLILIRKIAQSDLVDVPED